MVQKILDATAGVTHDLRLIGQDSQVPHQIDVTITRGGRSRRILVECNDLDISGEPVGLPIVRDFFGDCRAGDLAARGVVTESLVGGTISK